MKPSAPGNTDKAAGITINPRGFPLWAQTLAVAFSMSISAIVLAGPLVPLVTQRMIVDAHAPQTAVPLLIGILGACAAVAVLHFARLKALTGFERAWPTVSYRVAAIAGVLITVILALIHPLLSVPPVFAGLLSLASGWIRRRVHGAAVGGDPEVVAAVLSGVEDRSVLLARKRRADHAVVGTLGLGLLVGFMVAMVTVDYLLARGVLSTDMRLGSYAAVAWPVAMLAIAPAMLVARPMPGGGPVVQALTADAGLPKRGTVVRNLTATGPDSSRFLTSLNFDIEPGAAVGISGPSASGKSLLLQAIANPHLLPPGAVEGMILIDGQPVWERDGQPHRPRLVHVGPSALTLDGSGVENIACGLRARGEELSRVALEDLFVFGGAADRILLSTNARTLSDREKQISALARAFLLGPSLYLFDTPETALTARDIGRVASKIAAEKNAGRSILMVTNDRTLLDCCDTILILNDGRITDRGPRETVLRRQQSGRARLLLERSADEEDRLHNWLRSQFNRPGDERNRRNICLAASEALSLPHQSDRLRAESAIVWEFQHQKGRAILEMSDQGQPISPTELRRGKELANASDAYSADTPIANLHRRAEAIEQETDNLEPPYSRKLRLTVSTYDPRDSEPGELKAAADAGT